MAQRAACDEEPGASSIAFAFCVNAAIDLFPSRPPVRGNRLFLLFDKRLGLVRTTQEIADARSPAIVEVTDAFARFKRTVVRAQAQRRGRTLRLLLADPHHPLGNRWLRAMWPGRPHLTPGSGARGENT